MSTVAPIEDVDLSWVDLEEGVPCAINGCANEAAWKLRCRKCGGGVLICDEHKRHWEALTTVGPIGVRCEYCQGPYRPLHVSFHVIPI